MTRMLASVRDLPEAFIALEGGADIIDLKEPARGALGAVEPHVLRDVARELAGRVPISAVTGDLPLLPEPVTRAVAAAVEAGAVIVKIGLFPDGDPEAALLALEPFTRRAQLVGVLFADREPDLSLLPLLARAGFAGAMLDTATKGTGGLLQHMSLPALHRFTTACAAHGLFAGLAGALEAPDVPRLLVLRPAVLGFRGALCGPASREAPISLDAVRRIRALIPPETGRGAGEREHTSTLAAQGYAAGEPPTDLVHLRDWVLPVRIGAYAREELTPQPVRFDVEAKIARASSPVHDMVDVFSYDIISDAIRMLTDDQHVALVETLAERIAALVLDHPRVVSVRVAVEKLDVGTGVVGVTIERRRDDPVPRADTLLGTGWA